MLLESLFDFANSLQAARFSIFYLSVISVTKFSAERKLKYNLIASLDKLSCTNLVEFGINEHHFERFFWSQKQLVENQLKVFRRDNKGEVCKNQQLNMEESDFTQIL